jgi:hypothetical protein
VRSRRGESGEMQRCRECVPSRTYCFRSVQGCMWRFFCTIRVTDTAPRTSDTAPQQGDAPARRWNPSKRLLTPRRSPQTTHPTVSPPCHLLSVPTSINFCQAGDCDKIFRWRLTVENVKPVMEQGTPSNRSSIRLKTPVRG